MTSTADDAATFTYDRTDQLKSATYQKPAYADLTFSYDANGNRTGGGNTPGPDNRQASDGVSDFAYDLDGNMTRRTNKTTGAVVEYAWDLRNRLTDVTFKSSATGPATKKVHYTYDALNRRIGKSVDTDGNGTLDQVDWYANRGLRTDRENAGDEVMLRLGASGNVTGRYLHGASVDEILAEENIASDGKREVLWTLADQQGSVRDIVRLGTNGQATVVDHIMYGPYGEKVAETDAAIVHLYGYTGREYDQETGLQYNRARYYDPKLGRWISQDPIGFDAGDANLYRMTGNHATYATDPSGLEDKKRREIKMPLTSAAEAKAAVALNNCPLNVFNPFSDGFMFYTLGPALYEGLTVAAPQSIDHAHDEVTDAVGRDSVAVYAIQGSHVFHKSVLYVGTGFVVGDYEDTYELLTGKDAGDGQILSTEDYRNVLSAAMFPGPISRKSIAGRQKIVDNQVDVVAPSKGAKPLNSPDPQKWVDKGGNVWNELDGTWVYRDAHGNTVRYPNGYPDFEGAGVVRQKVDISQKPNRTTDFTDADAAAPLGPKLDTNTWHHHENTTTMQEIDRMIHRRFTHRGGVSVKKGN
jgi:RHS repeat-associated protein